MATQDVLVVAVVGDAPIVVPADSAELVGQTILDYHTAHPTVPEFAVSVRPGTLETVDA